jgi:hypothetical protein
MEGLIKGLVKVAIDAVEGAGRDDDDEAPRRRTSHREADNEEEEGREERTRSTWSEVRVATCRTRSHSAIRAGHGYLVGHMLEDIFWLCGRWSPAAASRTTIAGIM